MNWIIKAHRTELAALLAALLFCLAGLAVWLEPYSGKTQASALSESWRGHSQMLEKLQWSAHPVRILSNLSSLHGSGILVIVAPNSEIEPAPVLSHLRQGGSLLLADNSPYSEKLLSELGVSRKAGPIVDKENYFRREDAPLAAYKDGWVALRQASALVSDGNWTPILSSSKSASWIDADHDGKITENDTRGPFDAAIALTYNSSRENAIIVSDSSLFSNDMLSEKYNLLFLLDSVERLDLQGSGSVFVYEGGKAGQSEYLALAAQLSEAFSSPYAVAGFALAFGLAAAFLASGKEEYQEGFTLFDRLVFGVSKNIGKQKAPYVWLMQKLSARLSEVIQACENRPGVDREAYAKARALQASIAGRDFPSMDALTLEAKIKEVSSAIAALERRDGKK